MNAVSKQLTTAAPFNEELPYRLWVETKGSSDPEDYDLTCQDYKYSDQALRAYSEASKISDLKVVILEFRGIKMLKYQAYPSQARIKNLTH